jgi:hypothetical protein
VPGSHENDRDLFRKAALEASRRPPAARPSELAALPRWVRGSFWVLVTAAAAAGWAARVTPVVDYATIPAVVLPAGPGESADPPCAVVARLSLGDLPGVRAGAAALFRPSEPGAASLEVVLEAAPEGVRARPRACPESLAAGVPAQAGLPGVLEVAAGSRPMLSLVPGIGSRAGAGR